jgi:hypothetical protein
MKSCSALAFAFAFGAFKMSWTFLWKEFALPEPAPKSLSIAWLRSSRADVQEAAPGALQVPAGHGVGAVFPVPPSKYPAGVVVQEVAPAALLKVPAGHGVGDVFPVPPSK